MELSFACFGDSGSTNAIDALRGWVLEDVTRIGRDGILREGPEGPALALPLPLASEPAAGLYAPRGGNGGSGSCGRSLSMLRYDEAGRCVLD